MAGRGSLKIERIPGGSVHVGRVLEVYTTEARELGELGRQMMLAAKGGKQGWLLEYLDAHKRAHAIFRDVLARSHT